MELSAEKLAVLQIARTPGIGPLTYKKIVAKAGSAQHVVESWQKFGGDKPLASADAIHRELETLEKNRGWYVVAGDAGYPHALSHIVDAPIVLCGLGDKAWLNHKHIALVGNRNASAAGLAWTRTLSSELVANGLGIVSGLARGIDSAAHRGALDAHGGTVAVVGSGVNHVYPPENASLREEIIAHGCVVSEHPWGMPPIASFFARRNRIIAGLSLGVVVSEAGRESGSLITAKCALEYGREVWAVPGSPGDPRAGGPNWLLKQGATLIEGAADILATLPAEAAAKPRTTQIDMFNLNEEKIAHEELTAPMKEGLATLLGRNAVSIDELVRQSGKSESSVMSELVELEIMGGAIREPDGRWRSS
jgi:DNA processing protein